VRFGAPDASLTGSAGVLALGELVAGLAQCQLLDGKFVNAVDRHRTDAAAQLLSAVPAVASTTAGGLTRCFGPARVAGIEAGNTTIIARGWSRLPARRRAAVLAGRVGIDLDATDVKVYGRLKRGVAYNYLGQRAGRPHLATWANTGSPWPRTCAPVCRTCAPTAARHFWAATGVAIASKQTRKSSPSMAPTLGSPSAVSAYTPSDSTSSVCSFRPGHPMMRTASLPSEVPPGGRCWVTGFGGADHHVARSAASFWRR